MAKEMEEFTQKKRETWVGHCEYMMSLFGYLSGSGDFWTFPYLFWKNGGGKIVFMFSLQQRRKNIKT